MKREVRGPDEVGGGKGLTVLILALSWLQAFSLLVEFLQHL